MAKNGSAAASTSAVRPPEGMVRVGSVANAGWWNLEKGAICHGELQNVYERPDERSRGGKSKFFQVRITAPTKVRLGRGKDAQVVDAKPGDVVNVNYGPKTKELEKFIPQIMRGAKYDVWLHVEGDKFDIGKGQTMWPIDVLVEMKQAAQIADEPDFDGVEDEADESGAAASAG